MKKTTPRNLMPTIKMKTFIITVSKTFMANHPRTGAKTFFKKKILSGDKIHTLRGNYTYWNNIATQVNAGQAILSLREWSGKPYASKQRIIKQYTKLGIQKILKMSNYIEIDKIPYSPGMMELAKNDGLSTKDFSDWFRVKEFKGCIIHFNPDFRY